MISVPSASSVQLKQMRTLGLLVSWELFEVEFVQWGLRRNTDCGHLLGPWLALKGSGASEVHGVTPVAKAALEGVFAGTGGLCCSVSKDTLPRPFNAVSGWRAVRLQALRGPETGCVAPFCLRLRMLV
jgi:hypothetical protein